MPEGIEVDKTVETKAGEKTFAGEWSKNVLTGSGPRKHEDELVVGHCLDPFEGRRAATIPYENLLDGVLAVGDSGSGKSTFSTNLLVQLASAGYGFCHIDTTGECKNLLRRLPEARLEDVVLLGPIGGEVRNGFDLFETGPQNHSVADAAATTSSVIHAGEPAGNVSQKLGESAAKLAIELDIPLPELLDVFSLDQDETDVDRFGPIMDKLLTIDEDSEELDPLKHRFIRLIENSSVRKGIAHPDPCSLYNAVQQGKIVLVAAGGYQTREAKRQFIGASLRKLSEVVRHRDKNSEMFIISIDELKQNELSEYRLEELFLDAREHNVGMLSIVQHLSQLTEDDKNLILNSSENLFCFRQTDIRSANILTPILDVEGHSDLMNLPLYTAFVTISARYESADMQLEMFPPLEPTRESNDDRQFY